MTQANGLDLRELAWASGIFEGEGCIHATKRGGAALSVEMADGDVMDRFHRAVGRLGGLNGPYSRGPRGGHHGLKPLWRWQVERFEYAQAVLALLWFGLGERRRMRAQEVFAAVRTRPAGKRIRGQRRCWRGHDLTAEGAVYKTSVKWRCRQCMRLWRHNHRERGL